MAACGRSGSWKSATAGLSTSKLGPRFAGLLKTNAPAEALAAAAASRSCPPALADENTIEQIRAGGGSNAEVILAAFLGLKGNRSPGKVYEEVGAWGASWREILAAAGGAAGMIEGDVRQCIR